MSNSVNKAKIDIKNKYIKIYKNIDTCLSKKNPLLQFNCRYFIHIQAKESFLVSITKVFSLPKHYEI